MICIALYFHLVGAVKVVCQTRNNLFKTHQSFQILCVNLICLIFLSVSYCLDSIRKSKRNHHNNFFLYTFFAFYKFAIHFYPPITKKKSLQGILIQLSPNQLNKRPDTKQKKLTNAR